VGYLNSVDEFLRGFKEENHVLGRYVTKVSIWVLESENF
jgi:hypothetical protein